ncbi:MAG: peptidylprolyl isomerase [Tissierellia bacterium]|nr:peptidylprolyl isomerase [Tissierellia bacterium]
MKQIGLDQIQWPRVGEEIAIIHTNFGDIKLRLFENIAPKACENFKTHAKDGYYNGVIFHRVIDGFMIQGGDPTGTGRGGKSIWGLPFEDEFDINYRNFRGALSMANSGRFTNGSQFFIVQAAVVQDNIIEQMRNAGESKGYPEDVVSAYESMGGAYWLDGKHTVFGQVFEGMEIVDDIAATEVDRADKPLEDVVIESIEIVKFK